MSATTPHPARRGVAPDALAGAVVVLAALWGSAAAPWLVLPGNPMGGIARRAAEPMAATVGTDGTLLLAGALPLDAAPALWAASWFGAALLACAVLAAGQRRPVLAAAVALAACLNPLALHAYSGGWGLAAAGVFVLVAQVIALPDRPYHRGMPLLGIALSVAAALVPGAPHLALPFFSMLWLAAPLPWRTGTMRALYLVAFFMPAAWFGTMAYFAARSGAPVPTGLPSGSEDGWHLALGLALACVCAPSLVAEAARRPAGVAVLGFAALAFIATGVPNTLAVFAAWSGQAAATLRYGGAWRTVALGAGTVAGAGAMALLA